MTAEIVVANKSAVAMAADSAVTVVSPRGGKTYNSVNKLFALSKIHPVGIMVFGSASFMGVPWELVIKYYRQQIGYKAFPTVEAYAEDFVSFICSNDKFLTRELEDAFFHGLVRGFFHMLRERIDEAVVEVAEAGKKPNVADMAERILRRHRELLKKQDELGSITESTATQILKSYERAYKSILSAVFDDLPLSTSAKRTLRAIAKLLLHKQVYPDDVSGIVVAGFGDEEVFPAILSYQMNGVLRGRLRGERDRQHQISHESSAAVMPFAQHEMVVTFMEGSDPDFRHQIQRAVREALKNVGDMLIGELGSHVSHDMKRRLRRRMSEFRQAEQRRLFEELGRYTARKHVDPILEAIEVLPKDELAVVAESLVNLTSFKRRVSLGLETVGGPIDVAVVSKGDGFIWIKRKHYFRQDMNPHFLANYFRDLGEEEGTHHVEEAR